MPRLTLNRVFALSLAGLLGGLALLFSLIFYGLQNALLKSAVQQRDRDSAAIGQSVTDYLGQAPASVEYFKSLVKAGITKPADPQSLRDALLTVLLRNDGVSEATFTYAKRSGFDANGLSIIDPATVGQVDLFRAKEGPGLVHRNTWYENGHFLSTHYQLALNGQETQVGTQIEAQNPASHLTFISPARSDEKGNLLWTDLHWFAVDAALPEAQRRVEVSVQEALDDVQGQFAGVLRIGLFKDAIDNAIAKPPAVDVGTHSIFLCVNDGGLIALSGSSGPALSGSSHYILSNGDVRLDPTGAPPQVMAALERPALRSVDSSNQTVTDQFVTSGTTFLCSFRYLPETQDWIIGMTVPRRAYLEDLLDVTRKVVWGSLALAVVMGLVGGIVLHAVSRAHSVILREAGLMNDFVLDPSKNSCNFYDINRVLSSLERAKTAMRSMGKYVPMDLVRRLYHRGEEPRLGGEATEVSALFTDIKGFTEFSESEDADIVAARLGQYLHVMVSIIQGEKGTIDKFIGDSVMAFWNAPEPVPDNATLACRAILACREALERLYASPEWAGTPGFETRFGLHHCVASVGHFGAPERFNYTAIGDGINIASRLEGLNKHYGTSIIASGAVRDTVGAGFLFRRLDRVAVKGKTRSLDIYELIGDSTTPLPPHVAIYEQALEAWFEGDFKRALGLVSSQLSDPPSAFLAARCRAFIASPPPADWGGVYVFDSK